MRTPWRRSSSGSPSGRPIWTRPPAARSAPNRVPAPPAASGRRCWRWAVACESGASIIAEHTGLAGDLATADLVITGEGRFDDQSLHGKVVGALAAAARSSQVPVIVLAGQVDLDEAALQAAGMLAALRITDYAGSVRLAHGRCRQPADGIGRHRSRLRLGNSGPTRYR